jgi:exosortase A-associated hydrolase 1
MRRVARFTCQEASCVATLDEAAGNTGLLIVSGGNEIRSGAHRGMARLAKDIAAAGYPVFRFDRRGIGDSEGQNGGFESSAADIEAALAVFRAEQPQLTRVVSFGNCDAATALVLHRPALDALVLANPWVIEAKDDLPPSAAIKDRYARRLRDPAAWVALLKGKINIAAVVRGLSRIAAPAKPSDLASRFADAMTSSRILVHVLLASGDGTALAFADAWKSDAFATVRRRADVTVETIDSTSHSFSNESDYAALKATLLRALTA